MGSTSPASIATAPARWQFTNLGRVFVVGGILIAMLPFLDALGQLFNVWNLEPEYSHGMLIPPIAAFLIWRQRAWLATTEFRGSWSGALLVIMGLALWLVGELSTIPSIVYYGFLLVLYGLVIALTGWAVFRRLWVPLLILVFMIPLPAFFSNSLSLQLQLLSSAIGVWIIRLFGISVFLEGNVIDLGAFKLQVAEACDGLRYLFPLMTLAFIVAYFFRAPLFKKLILFASSIPIAILMNSFRIGVIGVTVEYWGGEMAEGVLHDFEGWVVFMLSTIALLGVGAALSRLGKSRTTLRDALILDAGEPIPKRKDAAHATTRRVPHAFMVATALAATASISAFAMPQRPVEDVPARTSLVEFPNHLAGWQGRRQPIEDIYLDALKLDDYLMADYRDSSGVPVNFYVAYYDSQRKGHSVHSPKSCLPGGGWIIRSFDRRTVQAGAQSLPVNRAVIELGRSKQIVYYWFQQRGRVITNEYLVKWYIFWDALTRNRTDGALVRLTTVVPMGMEESQADEQLSRFAAAAIPQMGSYVPN